MNPEDFGIRLTRIAATDAALKVTIFPQLSVLVLSAAAIKRWNTRDYCWPVLPQAVTTLTSSSFVIATLLPPASLDLPTGPPTAKSWGGEKNYRLHRPPGLSKFFHCTRVSQTPRTTSRQHHVNKKCFFCLSSVTKKSERPSIILEQNQNAHH